MPSDPNSNPNPPPSGKPRRRPAPGLGGNLIWVIVLALLVGWFIFNAPTGGGTIEWGEFWTLLEKNKLRKVNIGSERISGEVKDTDGIPDTLQKKLRSNRFNVERIHLEDNGALDAALRKQVKDNGLQVAQEPDHLWFMQPLMVFVLPIVILLALFLFLLPRFRDPLGGGFLSNYIKSPARRYERSKLRVTFEDVAGMQNAKSELQEVVEFLRSPEKFQRLGAVVPKGVLLVGPPGTGKTLLARAVAGEAGVPFFSISGSEFIQMFVGVGASRVRDMFKTAKENSPAILFIDEIDAVGRMRGAGVGGGSDEREQTLNQILSEMDGFTPTETVIVMAATNRPDVLDSALLRPGRFDRHITIDRPTWQGRLAILKVHTRNKPLADDVNLETIARGMIGMTGADLRNLANEAALLATRENKNKIDRSDFERAADRVLIGPKREEVLSSEDKRRTAYHEAGHALCAWLTPKADPIFKLTIIPRGRSLGMTRFRPDEERLDYTKKQLMARLIVAMGGRAADRLVFEEETSGANQDLKDATRIARLMVTQFGMSDRIGPVAYRIGEEHIFLGKEIQEPRDFSEGTAEVIDEEVRRILREADEHAYNLLQTHRHLMERLVEALMQREELLREEIDEILKEEENANGIVAAPGIMPPPSSAPRTT
ncbi:MAG TPA: ATP-dependent zinc metalloprotease FtsH [Gemmataceae bacterium]|jgi:cell division protease FtsH